MASSPQPLVAVMTPVHNGAEFLAACLESVRAQIYQNWIHLVVDNASTDATRQIAESFAATDPRVRVLSYRELLPMFENFNRPLAEIPTAAVYLKQIHADDTLHPACLRTMVATAECDPTVALVVNRFYLGSLRTESEKCTCAGCATLRTHGRTGDAARHLPLPESVPQGPGTAPA